MSRLGSSGIAENPLRPGSWQESCGTLRTFVGLTRRRRAGFANREVVSWYWRFFTDNHPCAPAKFQRIGAVYDLTPGSLPWSKVKGVIRKKSTPQTRKMGMHALSTWLTKSTRCLCRWRLAGFYSENHTRLPLYRGLSVPNCGVRPDNPSPLLGPLSAKSLHLYLSSGAQE